MTAHPDVVLRVALIPYPPAEHADLERLWLAMGFHRDGRSPTERIRAFGAVVAGRRQNTRAFAP